jgi:PAS domain S-box-containing protein
MEIDDKSIENGQYQALIQSFTEYVVAVNRNYQIIMANDLFKDEFGVQPGELCYKAWKNRSEKCENCLVQKSFQDGAEHWDLEEVVMRNGHTSQMLIKSTPAKNGHGNIVYVLETATAITEKKLLQENFQKVKSKFDKMVADRLIDLQTSEEKYRTIFERSRDAIILSDKDDKIAEINPAGREMLGYRARKDELLSLRSLDELFYDKEDFHRFQEAVYREGFVTEFETLMIGKNNRTFDALATANMIVDSAGQVNGYSMIVRNITKRKQAQQQLAKRNTTLTTLNAISKVVSSSLDLREVLNSTVDKLLEVLEPNSIRIYLVDSKKEILSIAVHRGLSDKFVSSRHIRQRKVGAGLLGRAFQSGQIRVVENFMSSDDPYRQFIKKEGMNGTVFASIIEEGLQSSVYVPVVSKGKNVGIMVLSNRSQDKFSKDYLEFLSAVGNQIGVAVDNANLYENIKGAYEELKKAQEQVIRSEKLASLGKLAATIAHEINNPIAAVFNYIRLMIKLIERKRFTPEKLDDIHRYLSTMESEISRCGEIVKNLLAFSRQTGLTMEIQSIEEIIDRTLALLDHDLVMKEIHTVKEIASDLPKIRCDFRQIQQALLNLIGNASEAMTKGGVLTLSATHPADRQSIEIAISDSGSGIPENDLKNIFEPFFTTKEEGKGVGLGLSVVYGIITKHKGSVEVESELDKGTTFRVKLPAA